MAYPTSLDALPENSTNATPMMDTHPDLHNDANAAINALEEKVGIDGSADNTTHDYKLSGVADGDKAASLTGTETMTNKRLTSPKINENVELTATATDLNFIDGVGDAWTSFTPSIANFTVGSGTLTGRYKKIGTLVAGVVSASLAANSSVGTNPLLTLPVAKSSSLNANTPIGVTRYYDNGTAIYLGQITASGNLTVYGAGGTYVNEAFPSATVPFTWTNTDAFWIWFIYESAT